MSFFKKHWRKLAALDVVAVILVAYLSFIGIDTDSLFTNDDGCAFCGNSSTASGRDSLSSIHSQVSMDNPFTSSVTEVSSDASSCGCQQEK